MPIGVDAQVGKEFEVTAPEPRARAYTARMKVTKVDGGQPRVLIKNCAALALPYERRIARADAKSQTPTDYCFG